jgi:hypothetical protein
MDSYLALSTLLKKEKFYDVTPTGAVAVETNNSDSKTTKIVEFTSFAVSLVIGLFAAYLSWTCYENVTYSSMPARILFAVFAYIFGTLYLITYALFKTSNCSRPRSRHHSSSRR